MARFLILALAGAALFGADARELQERGAKLMQEGRYQEGEAVLREAIQVMTAAYGEGAWQLGPVLSNLSLALVRRGELARAEPVLRRAVYLNQLAPHRDARQRALDTHNLGTLALQQGKFGEAKRILLQAETQWQEAGAQDSEAALETQNALVSLAIWTRELAEAEQRLDTARTEAARAGLAGRPVAAVLLMNLGVLRGLQGKSAAGMAALGQAVRVHLATVPARHPVLLQSVDLYARLLRRTRDRHGEKIALVWKQMLAAAPAGELFPALCPAEGDCCEYWRNQKL